MFWRSCGESLLIMNNDLNLSAGEDRTRTSAWKAIVARYQKPSLGRGLWQIANTLVPYAILWYLM